ncbi:hypothetical protein [Legionella anisa]|uniref:hypothetical protein n=1 Tax=Legionella anisa TaxID=28082 RepID=UPI000D70741D|nr:hypothetical protein [Legionella anisa]AWN75236.1 hypothetical protein DLD14_16140 [Legionella anisa]HAT9164406.1 hypothetical protein [Legionella pneumophila subsp. pneumophila]
MDDAELNTGIEYLKDYIKTSYSDLHISEGLIVNNNIIIRFSNRRKNLVLSIIKFGDVIKQLPWSSNNLKKHLDKERKEIDKDRISLFKEIKNQLQ